MTTCTLMMLMQQRGELGVKIQRRINPLTLNSSRFTSSAVLSKQIVKWIFAPSGFGCCLTNSPFGFNITSSGCWLLMPGYWFRVCICYALILISCLAMNADDEGQAEVCRETDDSWGSRVSVRWQPPSKDLAWGSGAFQLDMCMSGRCI